MFRSHVKVSQIKWIYAPLFKNNLKVVTTTQKTTITIFDIFYLGCTSKDLVEMKRERKARLGKVYGTKAVAKQNFRSILLLFPNFKWTNHLLYLFELHMCTFNSNAFFFVLPHSTRKPYHFNVRASTVTMATTYYLLSPTSRWLYISQVSQEPSKSYQNELTKDISLSLDNKLFGEGLFINKRGVNSQKVFLRFYPLITFPTPVV